MAWRLNELHWASERERGREEGRKVVRVLAALLTKWHGIFQGKHAEFCIPKEPDNANRERDREKERERSKGKNEKSKLIRFYSSPYTNILLSYPMNASSNCVINELPHGQTAPQCAPPSAPLHFPLWPQLLHLAGDPHGTLIELLVGWLRPWDRRQPEKNKRERLAKSKAQLADTLHSQLAFTFSFIFNL